MSGFRPNQLPLRLRLTIWYTFVLGFILLAFTTFLYFQVRRSLIAQVDAALRLAANQALIGVGDVGGQPGFQVDVQNPEAIRSLQDDFVIYLLAENEEVVGTLSNEDQIPVIAGQPDGFKTQVIDGESWRVYRHSFELENASGWIQVIQELEPVQVTLAGLQAQIITGLPLVLLLAGLGGYFLASRALRPIDAITKTANSISAGELNRRLHYDGPEDEVGRLAQTFDSMLDRLQAAFNRERQFTGDAAHELRTPLTALKGRIGVTLSQPREPDAYRETLAEMEGQVDRLIRLSSDLLFIARLEQGQLRLQRERIDLVNFLGAIVDQIRPLANAKAIAIEEDIPGRLALHGDMDLLIRLFLNLLDNAVKYTPQKGRVSIRTFEQGNTAQIMIEDNGPGISADHLPHLFERFYRIERDRSRFSYNGSEGGAGLGLAIAYEIARMHNGRITVESEIGSGTKFIVSLPVNEIE